MADSVQLTDLDVITRYSIAVRTATADRDELIETLRADLTWLESQRRSHPVRDEAPVDEVEEYEEPPAAPPRVPIRRMPVPKPRITVPRKTVAKRTVAKRAVTKKAVAKKAAPRRTAR
jgi:hypothetical protein